MEFEVTFKVRVSGVESMPGDPFENAKLLAIDRINQWRWWRSASTSYVDLDCQAEKLRPVHTHTFQLITFHVRNPHTGTVHSSALTLRDGQPEYVDCAEIMSCGARIDSGEITTDDLTCKKCNRNGLILNVLDPNAGIYDGEIHTVKCDFPH